MSDFKPRFNPTDPNHLTNTQTESIAEPMDLLLNKVFNKRPLVASSSNISYADSEEMDKSSSSALKDVNTIKGGNDPFEQPTTSKRLIAPIKRKKTENTDNLNKSVETDLALEPVKHILTQHPDAYVIRFEQYR